MKTATSTKNATSKKSSKKNTPVVNQEQPVIEAPAPQEAPVTDQNPAVEEAPVVETPATEEKPVAEKPSESGPRTYKLIRVSKFGFALYRTAGIRGTVAISKSMFVGNPPAEVSVDASNWAAVGAQTTNRAPSPEKIAKMKAQLAKREALNAKQRDRLAKYGVEVEAPAAETEAPATESDASAL